MDVLMTVGLVAVVAGIAVTPFQEAVSRYRLNAAARTVATELRSARSLAQARGSIIEIDFDASARTLRAIDLSDPANPVRATKQLADGITFESVPGTNLRFFPRGSVRGGSVQLRNEYGHTVSVTMDASGRSTVSERAQGSSPQS